MNIDGNKKNKIGKNIKTARENAQLTQKRIENGERMITDIEIIGISMVLGISIEKLFEL